MNIATKTERTRSGEDSQHGRTHPSVPAKPAATVLLGALLRRDAESAGRAPANAPITSATRLASLDTAADPETGADTVKPRAAAKSRTVKKTAKTAAKRTASKRR